MAAVTQRENVIIVSNGDTLAGQGRICAVLVTAGSGAAAEVTISRSSDSGLLGKYKVPAGTSQEFGTEIRYKEDLVFTISGTGAEAYVYLEV